MKEEEAENRRKEERERGSEEKVKDRELKNLIYSNPADHK